MAFQVSDYVVTTDASGNTLFVTRSDGSSIPPDPQNTDYATFLEIDTAAHLCKRVTNELTDAQKWDTLISNINYQLNDTSWYMLSDSQLTAAQQANGAAWRKSMMDLPSSYPAIADAQAQYTTLMASKPPFVLQPPTPTIKVTSTDTSSSTDSQSSGT